LKAGFPGREEEFDGGMEVGIGQPNRRKSQLNGPGDDGSDRQKRIMKAVVGPDIERGIGNHNLLYKCIINSLEKVQARFDLGGEPNLERVTA
jgi:hypothetical protein